MPNLGSVTKFFPTPFENTLAMTLNGTIAPGAATVGINNLGNYTNGQVVVFVIDAGAASKQVFTGTVSGSNIVNVVWTYGTNVSHTDGAAIADYVTATDFGMMSKGIQVQHNQDGSHSNITATGITATSGTFTNLTISGSGTTVGWNPVGQVPNTVTANGNRSYTCVFNGVDLTGTLSPGMRLLLTRTVASPTQCTSLNGSTQFYSKSSPAGMTFTNNFVVSAWVKLTSYGAQSIIASRFNGTSGWGLQINTNGQVVIQAFNAGASNVFTLSSNQSIPLNKWVHVAAQTDMTATTNSPTVNYVMIDGVDVPATASRGGTNPTALIQAGNLEIGSWNGGGVPFPGKIAQVAIYSAKVIQANVLATISQGLAGTETSLISTYPFNNSINDLNANANNLTANGSAVATNSDSPFSVNSFGTPTGTTDYGIITKASFSTNTTLVVQVPEGCTIPTTGGVSAVSYATVKVPYGFPSQRGKWQIAFLIKADLAQASATSGTWYNLGNTQLNIPIGEWIADYAVVSRATNSTNNPGMYVTLSTANNSQTDALSSSSIFTTQSNVTIIGTHQKTLSLSLNAATLYYLNAAAQTGTNTTTLQFSGSSDGGGYLKAECAYL